MQAMLKAQSHATLRSKIIARDTYQYQKWKNRPGGIMYLDLVRAGGLCSPLGGAATSVNMSIAFSTQAQSQRKRWCHTSNMSLELLSIAQKNQILNSLRYRNFSTSFLVFQKEPLKPSSKVEETVRAVKEKKSQIVEEASPEAAVAVKETKTLSRRLKELPHTIMAELKHLWNGMVLLGLDIGVASRLALRLLKGKTLTRREHRLLVRTVGDMLKLVPFLVFVIVPFLEFLLPLVIHFFPGILPTTFTKASDREERLKNSLKMRLEVAKFFQTTLDDMSVQSKDKSSDTTKEFTDFFKKIKTTGEANNEEIVKFSSLFTDEMILDSLSRQQLIALGRVLGRSNLGVMSVLRLRIILALRNIAADDKIIMKEGIDSLNVQELQMACQARAMRAYGMSEDNLKAQLAQWLNLSVNEKVPVSLLLLARALMIPETPDASDQLKATISVLPDTVELKAKAAIIEREGIVDHKTQIDIIKEEEKKIREERAEREQTKLEEQIQLQKTEELRDTAPFMKDAAADDLSKKAEISTKDLEVLEDALDVLGKEKKRLFVEKEELDDLKEEMQDYQEDVEELKEVLASSGEKSNLQETKAAKNLFKKVNRMISKMETVLTDLESKGQKMKAKEKEDKEEEEKKKEGDLVKIDELMDVVKRIQKIPDESKLMQISKVLSKMDDDQDGAISVEEVLKVIEVIGKEHVELTSKQFEEIIELLDKEEALKIEGQIERALEKQSSVEKTVEASATEKDKKGEASPSSRPGSESSSDGSGGAGAGGSGGGSAGSGSAATNPTITTAIQNQTQKSAMISASPNGDGNKATVVKEPKDINNDTKKL